MAINNYYLFVQEHKSKIASAFMPNDDILAHELIFELEGKDAMPFELNLFNISSNKNGFTKSSDLSDLENIWLDYLPNSLAWPMMSERLKLLIENHLIGTEGIEWIMVKINSNVEQKKYFIPRFTNKLDVLDEDHTTYVPGTDHIIKPCFSSHKIMNYSIFYKPSSFWQISFPYVSEAIKMEILEKKYTGGSFEKTNII